MEVCVMGHKLGGSKGSPQQGSNRPKSVVPKKQPRVNPIPGSIITGPAKQKWGNPVPKPKPQPMPKPKPGGFQPPPILPKPGTKWPPGVPLKPPINVLMRAKRRGVK